MNDTYTIHVECFNCDAVGDIAIAKGNRADGDHICPTCGCQTARKKRKAVWVCETTPGWPRPFPPQ